jgi:hypothetical protein
MAWCLAISDPHTGRILARTTQAADRSHSVYADIINNLIAVLGWAEWHQPPGAAADRLSPRAVTQPGLHREHGRDNVHILNAGRSATWTGTGNPTAAGSGHVRPHRRRGHWRRQHHGPGNQLIKWIRINPTIVNAAAGPLPPQIYRLPNPCAMHQGADEEGFLRRRGD